MSFLILTILMANLCSQEQGEVNIYKLLYSGQFDSLHTQLEKMIKLDSTDAEIYFFFGMTYTFQNNKSEALKSFEKSYNLDAGNIKNLYYFANSLISSGYQKRAEKILREAVQLDSTRTDIWDSLGRLYYRNSNFEDCAEIYSMLSHMDALNGYHFLMQARCAVQPFRPCS